MKFIKFFEITILLLLVNCSVQNSNIRETYRASVVDAMVPESSEIYQLTPINQNNKSLIWKMIDNEKYLLVTNWTDDVSDYQNESVTTSDDIWITVAPELTNRMRDEKFTLANLRLNQLLGLPPQSGCNYFIEFWVKPEDIFRPCPDDEIDDNQCNLCFPESTDSSHISWINNYRINSYYSCELYDKYPWTQLGYTYDWNPKNKSHFGLSEFVVKTNSNIIIKKIYTTEEYLNR